MSKIKIILLFLNATVIYFLASSLVVTIHPSGWGVIILLAILVVAVPFLRPRSPSNAPTHWPMEVARSVRNILAAALVLSTLVTTVLAVGVHYATASTLLSSLFLTLTVVDWDHSRLFQIGENWWRARGGSIPLPLPVLAAIVRGVSTPEELIQLLEERLAALGEKDDTTPPIPDLLFPTCRARDITRGVGFKWGGRRGLPPQSPIEGRKTSHRSRTAATTRPKTGPRPKAGSGQKPNNPKRKVGQ